MARRDDFDPEGCGCFAFFILLIVAIPIGLAIEYPWLLVPAVLVGALLIYGWRIEKRERREQEALEQDEAARLYEEAIRSEEEARRQMIAEVARKTDVTQAVAYMTGVEFEEFMAEFLTLQGYEVELTKASGDQGVDLLLKEGDRSIAVQLKRYSRPLGNKPVQEVLGGMFHYKADEAWVIATAPFTRGAADLARSTGVKLIDGEELAEWLADVADEQESSPKTEPQAEESKGGADRSNLGVWHPHPDDLRPESPSDTSGAARLRELGNLLDAGLITQEEYEAKKAEILRGM
jgi:hypothetical protein